MLRVAAAVDLAELLEDQLLILAADADAAVGDLEHDGGRTARPDRSPVRARAQTVTVEPSAENLTALESRL